MSTVTNRDFDLVLLGATGYVGRLTARHLSRHAPPGLRIAAAGRSTGRLSRLREELGPLAASWSLVTVDVGDEQAVQALAARTRVLVSTVGPYLRHGMPVVTACAAAGTDYADLTGETLFVRRSIDACHALAQQTGARIVHSCGFDSVPSDLGVGLTAARVEADGQGQLGQTVLYVRSMRGGLSGGTIDSLRQQLIEVTDDPGLRSLVADPTSLTDGEDPRAIAGSTVPARRSGPSVLRRGADGRWQTPFAMGLFNRQIVLRSNALQGWPYGPMFTFREVVDTGRGALGAVKAAGLAVFLAAVMAGMSFAPTRRVLDRVLPDPGEGPSERARQRGRFRLEIQAESTGGTSYRTRFGADLDPGYGGTAVMLGESGLCLAADELPEQGGVLTPMTAMGEALAVRLRTRGFTIETEPLTG